MLPRLRIHSWLFLVFAVLAVVALTAAARPRASEAPAGDDDPSAPASRAVDARSAGETAVPEPIAPSEAPVRESFLTADREVSPMLEAIRIAWQEHDAERARLEEELAATTDPRACPSHLFRPCC